MYDLKDSQRTWLWYPVVKRKKQQQHAFLIGLGIGVIVLFFLFFGDSQDNVQRTTSQITPEKLGIANDRGEVMEEKLLMLRSKDYQEIKKSIGLQKDFCIYFQDEEGNLLNIDEDVHALGSPDIKINDQPCVW